MKNPFLEPGLFLLEKERKRRERFKIGVYASLAALAVLLSGLLIQGCQQSKKADATGETTDGNRPDTSSNQASVAFPSGGPDARGASVAAVPALTPSEPAVASPEPAVAPARTSSTVPTPSLPTPIPSAKDVVYVVKSGDNLTRIAKKHGTTTQALRSSNGLKSDRLVVGQKLKLPGVPAS